MRQAPRLDEAQRDVSAARHSQHLIRLHGRQAVNVRVGCRGPLDLGQEGARTDENHVRACHLLKRAQNQGNIAPRRQVTRMQVQ